MSKRRMSEKKSSRRNFLKVAGIAAGASVTGATAFAGLADDPGIQKLNPEQRTFMVEYEKWLNEFAEANRMKKKEPGNIENQNRMAALAERAAVWKPQLTEYMRDKNFALFWQSFTAHVTKEI